MGQNQAGNEPVTTEEKQEKVTDLVVNGQTYPVFKDEEGFFTEEVPEEHQAQAQAALEAWNASQENPEKERSPEAEKYRVNQLNNQKIAALEALVQKQNEAIMELKRSNTPTEKEEKDLFDADQLEQYINSQIEARLGKAQQSANETRRLENKLFEHGVPISKFQEWLSAHGGTEINSFSVNAFLSQ